MGNTKALIEAIVEMKEDKAFELTHQLLDKDTEPLAIFDAYKRALEEVGKRFEKQLYFIPELILAGNKSRPYRGKILLSSGFTSGNFLFLKKAKRLQISFIPK
jgi:methanogenic corrinoid protein MtbC1